MIAEIELIEAVAGTKNKASDYNTNFQRMKKYIEDNVDDMSGVVNNALTNYVTVNGLPNSGKIELEPNTINQITPINDVIFSLPEISDNTKFYQILVRMNLEERHYIDLGTDWGFNSRLPEISDIGKYNIIYEYDGANWVCGIMTRNEVA